MTNLRLVYSLFSSYLNFKIHVNGEKWKINMETQILKRKNLVFFFTQRKKLRNKTTKSLVLEHIFLQLLFSKLQFMGP